MTLENQLVGSFDRGPVDVRGLVAYTYLHVVPQIIHAVLRGLN
jgi:hypothetical protein